MAKSFEKDARLSKIQEILTKLLEEAETLMSFRDKEIKWAEDLEDWKKRTISEHSLQICAQCVLDIGSMTRKHLDLRKEEDNDEIFDILAEAKIISSELAEKMKGLGGFRNILVHEYLNISDQEVFNGLSQLDDFRNFAKEVTAFLAEYERKRTQNTGFTLIEILVVIAVLIITLAGGVVVWEKKVSPGPAAPPTQFPTTSPTPSPKPESTFPTEYSCNADSDCVLKDRPYCCGERLEYYKWCYPRNIEPETISCEGVGSCPGLVGSAKSCVCQNGKCTAIFTETRTNVSNLHQPCGPNDQCPMRQQCISYYGIAGPRGPLFKTCEIPCPNGDSDCPDGFICYAISDGPGLVCNRIP